MSEINVLLLKPYEKPKVVSVENTLKALQTLVEGPIEMVAPWSDPVVLICNEEGKITGQPLNRVLNGVDAIYGTFFVCGIKEQMFSSLGTEYIQKFTALFH